MAQIDLASRAGTEDLVSDRHHGLAALHAMQSTRIRELLAELVIDRGCDRSARYAELRRWFAAREATRSAWTSGTAPAV